jgi:hypothetical protein
LGQDLVSSASDSEPYRYLAAAAPGRNIVPKRPDQSTLIAA